MLKVINENTVIIDGTKYIAKERVDADTCIGCAFKGKYVACVNVECCNSLRKDKRNVIFVYVPKSYDEVINEYKQLENIQPNTILPKTLKEYCDKYPITTIEYYINSDSFIHKFTCPSKRRRNENTDRNLCSNLQTAKAFLALMQLIRLRDAYNNDWKPDWSDNTEDKYVIKLNRNDIVIHQFNIISNPLYFKSLKLAEEFLNNFRDLIEEAKELI